MSLALLLVGSIIMVGTGDARLVQAQAVECPPADSVAIDITPGSGQPPLDVTASVSGRLHVTNAEHSDTNGGFGPGVNVNWGDGSTTTQVLAGDAGVDNFCGGETFLEWFGDIGDTSANPTHTYQNPGTYRVSYTIDNRLESHDVGTVQVGISAPNTPPTVDAGTNGQAYGVGLGSAKLRLQGSVTDDGLPTPPGNLTTKWTQVSGPVTPSGTQAEATFASSTSPTSEITLPHVGAYVFKLTANDGELSSSDTVKITRLDHYKIELKAWIPHARVVDPVHPRPQPGPTPDSCFWGNPTGVGTQRSTFRGDAHTLYNGTYRARVPVEFDWNGTSIRNVQSPQGGQVGTTRRDWTLTKERLGTVLRCSQMGRGKPGATSRARDTTAFLKLRQADPFFKLFDTDGAPPLDGTLSANFVNPNRLKIDVRTDRFPNFGYRLMKNGQILYTHVPRETSCVPALGEVGVVNLTDGLLSFRQAPLSTRFVQTSAKTSRSITAPCRAPS